MYNIIIYIIYIIYIYKRLKPAGGESAAVRGKIGDGVTHACVPNILNGVVFEDVQTSRTLVVSIVLGGGRGGE